MAELRKLVPNAASYVSESNFFEASAVASDMERRYRNLSGLSPAQLSWIKQDHGTTLLVREHA
jgi:hypothetical protein